MKYIHIQSTFTLGQSHETLGRAFWLKCLTDAFSDFFTLCSILISGSDTTHTHTHAHTLTHFDAQIAAAETVAKLSASPTASLAANQAHFLASRQSAFASSC